VTLLIFLLALAAFILGVVANAQSQFRSLLGWAVLLVSLAVMLAFLGAARVL
jgi:hypothetical protein